MVMISVKEKLCDVFLNEWANPENQASYLSRTYVKGLCLGTNQIIDRVGLTVQGSTVRVPLIMAIRGAARISL
jgi:hypothetical protein